MQTNNFFFILDGLLRNYFFFILDSKDFSKLNSNFLCNDLNNVVEVIDKIISKKINLGFSTKNITNLIFLKTGLLLLYVSKSYLNKNKTNLDIKLLESNIKAILDEMIKVNPIELKENFTKEHLNTVKNFTTNTLNLDKKDLHKIIADVEFKINSIKKNIDLILIPDFIHESFVDNFKETVINEDYLQTTYNSELLFLEYYQKNINQICFNAEEKKNYMEYLTIRKLCYMLLEIARVFNTLFFTILYLSLCDPADKTNTEYLYYLNQYTVYKKIYPHLIYDVFFKEYQKLNYIEVEDIQNVETSTEKEN